MLVGGWSATKNAVSCTCTGGPHARGGGPAYSAYILPFHLRGPHARGGGQDITRQSRNLSCPTNFLTVVQD
jgi:hypothetical protein